MYNITFEYSVGVFSAPNTKNDTQSLRIETDYHQKPVKCNVKWSNFIKMLDCSHIISSCMFIICILRKCILHWYVTLCYLKAEEWYSMTIPNAENGIMYKYFAVYSWNSFTSQSLHQQRKNLWYKFSMNQEIKLQFMHKATEQHTMHTQHVNIARCAKKRHVLQNKIDQFWNGMNKFPAMNFK